MDKAVYTRLPWQDEQWQRLQQARQQGRLPHALLFGGPRGVGKEAFALAIAQATLCPDSDDEGRPCGICRHCHLLHSGTHPDFQWVVPEEESKSGEIKIEAIRKLTASAGLTAQSGGHKVIIIQPAHRMNTAAANSLLKTLEEPTRDTLIILLTDQPARLLPTIRSRCQQVLFQIPPHQDSLDWLGGKIKHADGETLLSLASGAPLLALKLDDADLLAARQRMLGQFLSLGKQQEDPVALAQAWTGFDGRLLLEWLAGWVIDLLRLKTAPQPPQLFNRDQTQALHSLADKLNSGALHRYLGSVYEARSLIDSNLNPQLVLEKLLIEWRACR
ncbi:MAG: DNA polymerase III subunit delta' [Candidatus Thiodiazotropha sp. (ex Myrtea spinifera)]|nr:DNA polymerase III subunit delta' [Candidatus Thiodiazotropha sp. (ex Myrtea spinifera)]MCU7830973.1 DNA polymerase III subunit delta' [Candidatus Thiodiazotropha sp. (ex Myrtea sp. 'scaly one' KF741663)]